MEKFVHSGHIIQVTEEKINNIVWERAYLPDGVIVFPINDEGEILLVKEKRPHETPNFRIKPVSGILEPDKGSPIENALREMQEEIGLTAHQIELLMVLKSSGTINHTQYFYVAKDLSPLKLPNPDGEDTILEIMKFSLDELLQKYMDDELKWSHSTLGFFRLYHRIKSFYK